MLCPKCKAVLESTATKCSACGFLLPTNVGGTLDPSKFLDGDESLADADAQSTVDIDFGTEMPLEPVRPGVDSDLEGTLQLSDSDESFDLSELDNDDSLAKTNHDANAESGRTIDFDDSQLLDSPADSDVQGTVLYEDGDPDAVKPSDATVDFVSREATVHEETPATGSKHGTVEYDSREISEAAGQSTDSGGSGSAGRLNRIWGGAGGSGSNPMHTLKGGGAMASDSIFERVANRVLIADKAQTIIESDVKKVGDRESVQRCLQTACQPSPMTLADYHINGFLGKGGMGIVMQARQSAIGRDVALKMILPSTSGSQTTSSTRDQQKKFLYEAQVTGKLDHPNIVPVYDLGVSNNVLFYSMKKIIGKEWTDQIADFTLEENLDVWMKVADAMAFSHQRSVIHRDLKPDNVMLGPFGEVLVTDWGCAVDLSLNEKFNGAGSPPWMAPEMANHRIEKIGVQSDIYLLGAILYQIIQGYPPHPGRTAMEVLRTAANNQIIPVDDPDPLMKIAMRAMETEPDDRYGTVEEMQEAIRQYRRHSESIALTERSETTLSQAIESKDYERFSRSVFGFQDALELWPENNIAAALLCKARYAYGECAYARKDYDLCLATLDRSEPDENALYVRAEKAKEVALQRESRLKFLWKALAAVILLGLAATSIAAGVAVLQRNEAVAQKSAAERSAEAEKAAREEETKAKDAAIKAREEEEKAKNTAIKAREEEEKAKLVAIKAREDEEKAKDAAIKAREDEEKAKIRAERSAVAEREAKLETEKRTAQVELAGLQSNLSLALGQVEQLDVGRATELLTELAQPESYSALAGRNQLPKLDSWAWNRINLLTNRDLLQDPWGQRVTAMAYAAQANVGVVATADRGNHRLQIVRLDRNRMVADERLSLDLGARPAESVLISPDGSQVVYALRSESNQDSVYRWNLQDMQATSIQSAQSRSLQGFVATKDAVIGGLNNGLWIWKNSVGRDQQPERITQILGRLVSIQMLDDHRILVLAQMPSGERYPHLIWLDQPEQRLYLRFDQALKSERLSAIAYSAGRLIVGTETGKLLSTTVLPGSDLEPALPGIQRKDFGFDFPADSLVEIPQQHISNIQSIVAHSDGQTMLTIAAEPLVHIWKADASTPSGFRHETRLTGTTKNISRAAFLTDPSHVLAIADDARSIVWDTVRHRQRQRVQRVMADGNTPTHYDAPVVTVVPCEDNLHAISILENGRIDRWNTQTGQSVHQVDVPLAYVGHDPNAQFVDMAIDEPSGILITSSRIPNSTRVSAEIATDSEVGSSRLTEWTWEFVKWDLNEGRMLDRWTRVTSEEQTVSLSSGGRFVLYGSDQSTQLRQPAQESSDNFLRQDFGSYQGYVNPRTTNLMMLVKLNGVVRIVDTDRLENTWDHPGYQLSQQDFFKVATNGDRTILGQWAPNGDAFYLVWDSGRVTELRWSDNQLRLGRDLHLADQRLDLSLPAKSIASNGVQQGSSIRIGSRWNLDMKVRSQAGNNILTTAVRFPGNSGLTRLSRIVFPAGDSPTTRQQSESAVGSVQLVLTDDDSPRLETQSLTLLRERLPNMNHRIAGARTLGADTYVATREGNVYRIHRGNIQVLGRPKLLSGAGDRSGNTIVTLHEGGILWRADWTGGGWQWKQLNMAPPDARQISLSPNGEELILQMDNSAMVVSSDSGHRLDHLPTTDSMIATAWQPNADATLAAVFLGGSVRLVDRSGTRDIGSLGDRQAKSLHFFSEAWNDANASASSWLAVHCQSNEGLASDEIVYLSLNPEQPKEVVLPLAIRPSVIECSPQEGLLVVGGQGSVTVYMAAPTLDEAGKELFSLPGHSGAELRSLRFTRDGKTLITADNLNRMFGWLSEDTLQGVTNQLATTIAKRNQVAQDAEQPQPERTRYVDRQPATGLGE